MDRRGRASLLWGAIGALSFLVLVQGYDLLAGLPVGLAPRLGVALAVGAAATALAYFVEGRFEPGGG